MTTDLSGITGHYVSDVHDAVECLAWVEALDEPVAIDTETTGLEWWTPRFCRLVQFGTRDEGWAIPVNEWHGLIEACMQAVCSKGLPVVLHNAKFDMHALDNAGYPLPSWHNVHDTKIMDHLLVPHRSHSLKPMAEARWGMQAGIGQKMLKALMAERKWDWATIPTSEPVYWQYGILDTILTRRIYDDLSPEVLGQFKEQYEREMTVQEVMFRAETRGLRVDPVETQRLYDEWHVEALNLGLLLQSKGIQNPASNRQVEACFRELGWDPEEFTATGQAVLNKAVKQLLAERYPDIAPQLIRYHRITKWSAVYLRRFLEMRDTNDRVHASINTMAARTGRMSITDPALQTLPSGEASIRNCVLPSEGRHLWSIDYQAQEARLFAAYSRDPGMIGALRAGEDLYTFAARAIYNDPTLSKESPVRKQAKVILLAFTYGAGVDKLAKATGLPHSEVADILARLFELFPNVRDLTGDHAIGGTYKGTPALTMGRRHQEEGLAYILTGGGRRGSVPSADEYYKGVNLLLQGTGADVLKAAVLRLDAAGLSDNIVLPVHDELLMEFDRGDTESPAEAARLMEDHSYRVPLTTECSGPFSRWGDHYA